MKDIRRQLSIVQDDIYRQTDKEEESIGRLVDLILNTVDDYQKQIPEQVEELVPSLQCAMEGIQQKDWVYTMDVIQYELLPIIEGWE